MSSSKTIGIIGGGQLGQMMAISAIYMGHKVIALDPAADCPASRVAEIIVAPYNDVDALRQLAERCDVLTYEFENVDADGLDAVIKDGQLPQGTDLLRISQNRIFEKDFLSNKAQVTVAPYKVVNSSQDLAEIDLSKNYVLKTATGGYDGHGQKVIRSEADLEEAYALADSADCVLEEFVNFDLEISVIVSGNGKDVTVFPVQENIHRNNILSKTIVPARISASLAEKAKAMAVRIAEQLNLSGTLCVEMFAAADDIIVNEIAPRPHNSGHYSIEACDFSQFDTHILGVLGTPLPAIKLHAPAVMLNVLGQHVEAAEKYVTENPSAHLHMYGKIEAKHNRKMGHVTLFSNVPDSVGEFGKGIDFQDKTMIQIIVNAFVEKDKTGAVVEVLYASADQDKVQAKYKELTAQYPENYLAIYSLPLDMDLNTLDHYPSVFIGKEEFEQKSWFTQIAYSQQLKKKGKINNMINRYSRPEMANIWSEENKYRAWLEVEILADEAWAELGEIPKEDVALIREKADFDIDRILEIEQETRHDVVAFTRAVSETLGEERKWVHYGLTSTDVVDTAYGYLYKQANDIIRRDLENFTNIIADKAKEHKFTIMMGRTHGVHAEPTTFGLKLATWYSEMKRNIERFEHAAAGVEAGKISGAVGNFANIPPFVEKYVCDKLGIHAQEISTQVLPRDLHAEYFAVLASIATSIERMATEIRGLQKSEQREVEEFFAKGQKGSSAMPHKRNPIGSENMTGLARVIRGHMITAYENVALWHERDISHSSAERIITPDTTILIDYMLNRFGNIVKNLTVFPENMIRNMHSTFGLIFSQRAMLTLIEKGMTREQAYDLVQPKTAYSWDNQVDFKPLLEADTEVTSRLTQEEIDEIFNPLYYTKRVDDIFERLGLGD